MVTCHACGQQNGSDGAYCVRCGQQLTSTGQPAGSAAGATRPYAEQPDEGTWDPGDLGTAGQRTPTWVGAAPAQGWTGGQPGGAAPYPPAGAPPYPPARPTRPGHRSKLPLIAGLATLVVLAAAVLLVVLLRGDDEPELNGIETRPPAEVLDEARVALRQASSVHVSGEFTSDGEDIGLDLVFAGADSKGTITVQGTTVELIKIGDVAYIKGDEQFYTDVAGGDEAAAELVAGRWIKAEGADAEDFQDFSLDSLADVFTPDEDEPLDPTVRQETYEGRPVVVVTQEDGSRLLVANSGPAFPLRVENTGGDEPGALDFRDYNAPVEIAAPPADEVLDLDELES